MLDAMVTAAHATCPALPDAIEACREALVAESPQTAINYVSALARFREFLPVIGLDPDAVATEALPDDVLGRLKRAAAVGRPKDQAGWWLRSLHPQARSARWSASRISSTS